MGPPSPAGSKEACQGRATRIPFQPWVLTHCNGRYSKQEGEDCGGKGGESLPNNSLLVWHESAFTVTREVKKRAKGPARTARRITSSFGFAACLFRLHVLLSAELTLDLFALQALLTALCTPHCMLLVSRSIHCGSRSSNLITCIDPNHCKIELDTLASLNCKSYS